MRWAPRLPALRQVLGDRRRANDRLRRSLWVSLLVHSLLFVLALPFALHHAEAPAEANTSTVLVERVPIPESARPPQLRCEREARAEDRELDAESQAQAKAEVERPEPPPLVVEPSPRDDALEFVRSPRETREPAPDSGRISTANRRVEHERVAQSRALVADGQADRGTHAGNPQRAVRSGAQPERAAAAAAAFQAAQERGEPSTPSQLREHREDALADADDALDPRTVPFSEALEAVRRSEPALAERQGWEPMAFRLTGLEERAETFAEAPLPDRAASMVVPAQESSQAKEALAQAEQQERRALEDQRARPQGSHQPERVPDQRQPMEQVTAPEPELRFEVEPLELMRLERDQQQRAVAEESSHRDRRRRAPPGSARASVASPTGAQSAAGGSVASPLDPPETIDAMTVLQTRVHPLASVLESLDDQLRTAWVIPLDIRVSGIVGTAGIEMVLDRRGRIHDVALTRPSGHASLDALAQAAVPDRLHGFQRLLDDDVRAAFPEEGLRIYYEFEYKDSPVAGIL